MPRELVHWRVLEGSLKDAPSKLVQIINENKEAAYLGAIAHDAPYFHKLGKSPFAEVAKFLHGTYGHDTFLPLYELLKACEDDRQRAFVLGMFSHAVADQVMHPMIYYFTGDYYHSDKKLKLKA